MYNWIGQLTADEGRLRKGRQLLCYAPNFIVIFICCLIGVVMFVIMAKLRRRIMRNMKELLRKRVTDYGFLRILMNGMAYFNHLSLTLYELLIVAPELTTASTTARRNELLSSFQIEGQEHIEHALRHKKGAIIFAAHTGNFFYYYWWLSQQYDCLAVATADNEQLRPIYLTFEKLGCHGLDYDRTPPIAMLNTLREHLRNNGVVFLLGDFYRDVFPLSSMFEHPTRSPHGTAMLALRNSVLIVPLFSRRSAGFRHNIEFGEPIQLDVHYKKHEKAEATMRLNMLLEQMILKGPAQWFYWFNVDERWENEAKKHMEQSHCSA